MYNTNDAGKAAFNLLTRPLLEQHGVAVTGVGVADGAGSDGYRSAIVAAGADKAAAFIPLLTVQGCTAMFDALKALNLAATPVVTTGLCADAPMRDHLRQAGDTGTVPDGWYFGGYGYSYDIAGYPPAELYLRVIKAFAAANNITGVEFTGFAGVQFANVLTVTKFLNAIGLDKVTSDALRAQANAFTGPMWGAVGPMACGANPVFKALCGVQVGIEQYKDGKWISVRDGYNNNPVDPSKQ